MVWKLGDPHDWSATGISSNTATVVIVVMVTTINEYYHHITLQLCYTTIISCYIYTRKA